jgi:chemotaxis protein MotB
MSETHFDDLEEHDESYFASFTDLLVGVLFIFIILLMVFASNFSQAVESVTSANESRKIVLEEIQQSLQEQGVTVTIDTDQGVLRLPEDVLFDTNKSTLNSKGHDALFKLAGILKDYMPCMAKLKIADVENEVFCESLELKSRNALETVLIEGHTDHTGTIERNWQLSAERAVTVFRSLTNAQPILDDGIVTTINLNGVERDIPVLAISGYADRRSTSSTANKSADDLKRDRRIDLRFIMKSPTPEDVKSINNLVKQ